MLEGTAGGHLDQTRAQEGPGQCPKSFKELPKVTFHSLPGKPVIHAVFHQKLIFSHP